MSWDALVVTGMSSAVLAGRYRLAERIGVGAMAEVYRAEDLALGRPVAVKMLHPGIEAFGHARERLRSEVRLLARLSHPGLVPVYDTGDEDGRGFLVMQLIDGGTLADRIAGGPIPPDDVAGFGAQLADILAYLHAQKLVHRDLKPSNVLLRGTGRVLLADFGIARALDAAHLTATNTTVGTAAYMAPEQVQGGTVGPPADIYALGLILIECLTGVPVYQGDNSFDVAAARLHRQPQVPHVNLGMPPVGLLEAMTHPEPDQRPTAEHLAARFQEPSHPHAPTFGPGSTAVLPLTTPTEVHGYSSGHQHAGRPHTPLRQRLSAAPDRRAFTSSPAAERLRALWQRRDTPTLFGVRADVAVGAGLALLGLLIILFVAGAPGGAPWSTQPTKPTTTAPAGPQRLPADLDRLDEAVSPR